MDMDTDVDTGTFMITLKGREVIKKTVMARGTSGGVYLPPRLIGCRVAIVVLEDDVAQKNDGDEQDK